jgi:hypothetical protein
MVTEKHPSSSLYFRKLMISDNRESKKQFEDAFSKEIDNFAEEIYKAYELCALIDKEMGKDGMREAYTVGFLFNAVRNLLDSFCLFISGYAVPAGNLMRHFSESVATAILISNKNLTYFDRLEKELDNFPFHKSVDFVLRKKSDLNIERRGWDAFKKIDKFYDKYSHATLLSLADILNFNSKMLSIGAQFDFDKIKIYAKEIKLRISAASFLRNVIEGIFEFNFEK